MVDDQGRARSSRQGAVTLTRRTLPPGWTIQRIPPARVWLAVVTPKYLPDQDGKPRPTTQRWQKRRWRAAWAALNPQRQIAARQWISHIAWRRLVGSGRLPLGEPKPHHLRQHDRFQPAFWQGDELTRTAAPIWVPYCWQQEIIIEDQVQDERTAGRRYLPRAGSRPSSVL